MSTFAYKPDDAETLRSERNTALATVKELRERLAFAEHICDQRYTKATFDAVLVRAERAEKQLEIYKGYCAEQEKSLREDFDKIAELRQQRDAAIADKEKFRKATKALICDLRNERDAAYERTERAEADAAAMYQWIEDEDCPHLGVAGQALLERLAKADELATAARKHAKNCTTQNYFDLKDALAEFDKAKGE